MLEAKIEETVCENKISKVPEDLLVQVLSFLPTKDAVTTMFLSKEWLLIWTMLRTLEYKDSKYKKDENKKSVWWFLDNSLQFHKDHLDHKIHVIEDLHIELGPQCPPDADVGKWIAYAVDRCVRDLKFELLWSNDPISLPKSLYNCESLTKLCLSRKILVDFPSSSSSCLPSLLELRLFFVEYKDEASQAMFLSCCPTLKLLVVRRKKDDNVSRFSVKVPSLRNLKYYNDEVDEEDDESDVEDTSRCLVIDTPAVRSLTILDYSGASCSIENMPYLKRALLDVKHFPQRSEKFIRSLSSVMFLTLDLTYEVVTRCSTIKFTQLTELTICPNIPDWVQPVMDILGNAPKLQSLTIDFEYLDRYDEEDLSLSWNQPSCVPKCLSSKLETIMWLDYLNDKEEKELLTYVFANSKCLKTAKIFLSSSFASLEEYNLVTQELKDISRVSESSKLLLDRQKRSL